MALYFQYLRGENKDKVVTLEFIDDISMPDMELWHFSDNFKCRRELIGLYGDKGAYTSGKILAQIKDPNSKWRFQEKKIQETHKKGVGKDGQEFDIPDPYFVSKSGEQINSEKVEIKAYDPYRSYIRIEIPANLYLSNKTEEEPPKEEVREEIKEEPLKQEVVHETVIEEKPQPQQPSNLTNLNDPIKILVDSCKKNPVMISMEVEMMLPAKSFYNMVLENYGEDDCKRMVKLIVEELDVTKIKDSIEKSLLESYNQEAE